MFCPYVYLLTNYLSTSNRNTEKRHGYANMFAILYNLELSFYIYFNFHSQTRLHRGMQLFCPCLPTIYLSIFKHTYSKETWVC